MTDNVVNAIEAKIGYKFKNSSILLKAITHSSYHIRNNDKLINYQRMEYLGDALLDFVIADELFKNYPAFDEGNLTKIRASVVSKKPLAGIIKSLGIDKFIRYDIKNTPLSEKIISDIFESIVAAMYLDSDSIEPARNFILQQLRPLIDLELRSSFTDFKTLLYEYCSITKLDLRFELEKTEGPPHDLVFYYNLYIDNELIAKGEGNTKRDAQQKCCEQAIIKLGVKV